MKNSYKKYEKYIIGLGMILFFMLLVFLATYNQFDRAKAAGTWRATYLAINFGDGNGIAWYAIFIMTGVIYAVILGYLEFKRAKINPDILWDGLLYTLPLAIIGARLWYVFADILKSMSLGQLQNNEFIRDPLLIFGITNQGLQLQGLAIHGAIVVTVVFLIFFTRWKKISYWYVLDVVGPGFMIGQAIGRWGNFINRELYGPVMNFYQWMPNFIRERMDFALGDTMVNTSQPPVYHHPVFLYESSWNLIGLIVIISLRHKRIFKVGDIISFYLVWYGIGRIPVELLRISESGLSGEPLAVGGLSISILTSIGLILTGVAIFLLRRFYFKSKDGYYTDYGKEAILFDLDGTLLDTKEFIFEIVVETFKKYKPEVKLTEKDLLGFFGPTLEESFSKYEENKEKRDEMIRYFRKINDKKHHQQGPKAFPHAKETLIELKKRGYVLGVVSSKRSDFVKLGLNQNELLEYFDVIIGMEEVNQHKPHPEPILAAIDALGISKNNTTYIGDHPNDILAAKNAGVESIGVAWSSHYEDLLGQKPDAVIETLDNLLHLF